MSTTINLKRKNIDLPADTLKNVFYGCFARKKS